MKAKFLPAILFTIVILACGAARSEHDRPSQQEILWACDRANWLIPELIESAPHGTGVVNRTKAWFETWFLIAGDLISWIFNTQGKRELSQEGHAVIVVDMHHPQMNAPIRIIANEYFDEIDEDGLDEVIKEFLPSKLEQPQNYIIGLQSLRRILIDPTCKRFLVK